MSWVFSRVLVEDYLQATCSDGEQFAQLSTNSTPLAYLCNDKTMGSFRHSRYGITFAHLTEDIGEELLTWFREVSLAKTLAQQEQTAATKERDLTEASQDCGASLPESLAKLNQSGYWLKTPITCEPKVLDEFSKIWPGSGMMQRGGVLSAKDCGANHERKRMWIVAHTNIPQRQRGWIPSGGNQEHANFRVGAWWKDQPSIHRVDDGVAYRMDRLKAVGNGQVPIVAATAFNQLANVLAKYSSQRSAS